MITRLATSSALLLCLAGLAAGAHAETTHPVTFTVRTDAASSFVWRGMELNDEVVFQPALEMKVKGWTFGTAATLDLDDDAAGKSLQDFQRVDYHAGYAHEFGRVTVGGGVYFYDFPGTGMDDTTEGYVKVAVRYPCMFGLTLYHDFDETRGEYANGFAGHRFQLAPRTSLDLMGSLGWGDRDNNAAWMGVDRNALSDFETRLSVRHSFNHIISMHGYAAYTVLCDDRLRDAVGDDDNVHAGVGADFTF